MPKNKQIIKIIIININKYINTEPILSYKNKDCTIEFFNIFSYCGDYGELSYHQETQQCGSRYQN